jgi:leucine dehydrogenase
MAVFDQQSYAAHERIIFVSDRAAGLTAIIAMHDRTLGPAVGGTRVYPYASESDALADVLRLSQGMTYKNALAGLPFGGGKSVIIRDPADKSQALIRAFGRAVNELQGQYWTGEDVNFSASDVETLATETPYVLGRTRGTVNTGDPSAFTAGGVFAGMTAALAHVFDDDSFVGRRVAIQGVGGVGYQLAKRVKAAGGSLVIADIRNDLAARVSQEFGAKRVEADAVYEQPCDVFAPCAMGATISHETVPKLRAPIVCGAANNQLAAAEIGQLLLDRNIVYAPDYVVNAGGIINAFGDYSGRYDVEEVWRRVDAIRETTLQVLDESRRRRRPSHVIADAMAEAILAEKRKTVAAAAN